jgi:hypothetical protein
MPDATETFAALLRRYCDQNDEPRDVPRVSVAEAVQQGDDPLHIIPYFASLGLTVRTLDDLLLVNADETEEDIHLPRGRGRGGDHGQRRPLAAVRALSPAMIDINDTDIVVTRRASDGRFVIFASTDVKPDWPLRWRTVVADTGGDGFGFLVRLDKDAAPEGWTARQLLAAHCLT